MAEEKVFHPEEIIDAPFPGQDIPIPAPQAKPPTGTYVPTATKEKNFPKKRIATELIGQALNTRSKKILQEFELQQSGGLKIGDFKKGLTGDLRLTPNGLTARDQAGITTFSIDGTTGDAIFKGTVQAGSVIAGAIISGEITVGGSGNSEGKIHVLDSTDVEKVTIDKDGIVINSGKLTIKDANETTIIDATGLVSTANFNAGSYYEDNRASHTFSQTNVWEDLSGTSLTFNLARTTKVCFAYMVWAVPNPSNGDATLRMSVSGVADADLPVHQLSGTFLQYPLLKVLEVPQASPVTFKLQLKKGTGTPANSVDFGGGYIYTAYIVLGS